MTSQTTSSDAALRARPAADKEGREAFDAGRFAARNPYKRMTREWAEWINGWHAGAAADRARYVRELNRQDYADRSENFHWEAGL